VYICDGLAIYVCYLLRYTNRDVSLIVTHIHTHTHTPTRALAHR